MTTYNEQDQAQIAELLIGHKISKVNEDTLLLDDGTLLQLAGNDGCGGCSSGWYDLTELNEVDNIITKVKFVDESDGDGRSGSGFYAIFVYAANKRINLARFEGSDGNGYYGTGYTVSVNPVK